MSNKYSFRSGQVHASTFVIIGLSVVAAGLLVFGVMSYRNYSELKRDVDGRISDAVDAKVLETTQDLQAQFEKASNEPYKEFVGPTDYGRLTFDYPKKWSAYQATDVSGGGGATYELYLNPDHVPPLVEGQKFALRVKIEQVLYDDAVNSYNDKIDAGDVKSSVYSDHGITGTKLQGNIEPDMFGTIILIKMRDRTLTMRTDGDVFQNEFDTIMSTVKFNE